MTWNYRVIQHEILAIHEVYYDDKGNIESWTADPVAIMGDTKEELLETLDMMKRATEEPFLVLSELVEKHGTG